VNKSIRRIAINTCGGDAPGQNAVIRAAVLSALRRGWEILGIRRGYEGLLDTSKTFPLDREAVRGITHLGGTILGTTNRGNPFEFPVKDHKGSVEVVDRSDEVVRNFKRLGLDALIAIGGDGSMRIAHRLSERGLPVVGVPKAIENDLSHTEVTFGFDTAVGVATDALGRLHSTAEAHERVFVVEVMGRYAGWVALSAGVSSTADAILIPEMPFDIDVVCEKIMDREARGRRFSIVVVAEGALPIGGEPVTQASKDAGCEVWPGGISEWLVARIAEITGKETRNVVLGHLQRGGMPTTFDRLIALRFGAAAVRMINQRKFGVMVALDPPRVRAVPLSSTIERMKSVPLDCDTILTARDLGISFGTRED
jgi:6-phosphofructokinase 1